MVLTAGTWPTREETHKRLWIFMKSCERFGISPTIYGIGTKQFPGYRAMKLDMQLAFLKQLSPDHTHVLYTDALDAFFTGPLDEIIESYKSYGSPAILSSAFFQLANESNEMLNYPGCFDHSIFYRFPNVGGYMAEIPAIIEAFEKMLLQSVQTNDDCFNWYLGWKEGWFRPVLDSRCDIWHISDNYAEVENGRLYNSFTKSNPCILHLSGGYTSQENGKDDRMIPWAKRLGII